MEETPSVMPAKVQAIVLKRSGRFLTAGYCLIWRIDFILASINRIIVDVYSD